MSRSAEKSLLHFVSVDTPDRAERSAKPAVCHSVEANARASCVAPSSALDDDMTMRGLASM